MARVLLSVICIALQLLPANADQNRINYIAEHLEITYKVEANFDFNTNTETKDHLRGSLLLRNTGDETITTGSWEIYFCHIRLFYNTSHNQHGSLLGDSGLKVYHINGCVHKISPTVDFEDIGKGESLNVTFYAQWWEASRTDIMPNWYVTENGTNPKVIKSTEGESLDFVTDFLEESQYKRLKDDKVIPFTVEVRYDDNAGIDNLGLASKIMPTPEQQEWSSSTLTVSSGDWIIARESSLISEAEFLAGKLGLNSQDIDGSSSSKVIRLHVDDTLEGYSLQIKASEELIILKGNNPAQVFWGIQTILSLQAEQQLFSWTVSEGTVTDKPRFEFRGMHLDVSRNFFDKDAVKSVLDVMAMYKLNKLHLHLSDDEGWRLQIPGLQELTDVGGNRCHDLSKEECVLSQLGSHPDKGNLGSGFYTVDDYKDILTYANTRHIQVIPEFDTPGHAHAPIISMLARYQKLQGTDLTEAEKYLLAEKDDPSEYLSVQMFTDNAMNPCIESVYTFMTEVMTQVKEMHKDIQPLEVFHFGGDEVPSGAWKDTPSCKSMYGDDSALIKEMYVERLAGIAKDLGLHLGTWEDGVLEAGDVFNITPGVDMYANAWNNVWEWGGAPNAYILANAGYKTILSPVTHLYFDHPYEPDPEERGYYWGPRYTDTKKVFGYDAMDMYNNIDVSRMGDPLTKDNVCKDENGENICEVLTESENIIGIQGHLWSETVRTREQLQYMIFPRVLALAERAWHKAGWEGSENSNNAAARKEDWEKFANTLGHKELARLDTMNIKYAVPPPGVKVDDDLTVRANTAYPGLTIQYSTSSEDGWKDFTDQKMSGGEAFWFRTKSASGNRFSRVVKITTGTASAANYVHITLINLTIILCFLAALI